MRGEVVGALFHGGNAARQSPTSMAGLIDAGVTYRFDVLKYVPYATAGVGALLPAGGPLARSPSAGVVVGGGLDVLASRERSWGLELRLASFGGDVTVVTIGVRGTARWGYF